MERPEKRQRLLDAQLPLLGRRSEALDAPRRDVDLGVRDAACLAAERWFEGLRNDTRSRALLDRMRRAPPPASAP